jgi:hypothetical protein
MGLDAETFQRAKEVTRAIVSDADSVTAAVLTTERGSSPRVLSGKASALKELDEIALSHGRADYLTAFRAAFDSLGKAGENREIVLVTDLAQGGWEEFNLSGLGRYDPTITVRIERSSRRAGSSVKGWRGPLSLRG